MCDLGERSLKKLLSSERQSVNSYGVLKRVNAVNFNWLHLAC